jgi:hypothetical protein
MSVRYLKLLALLLMVVPPLARPEIYANRPRPDATTGAGARDVIERRIIVDGIPTVGRSWNATGALEDFARRAIESARRNPYPAPPRFRLDAGGMTLVQFMPAERDDENLLGATARVLIARPTPQPGVTSVWEAEVPVNELLRQAAAQARGAGPGRDHPVLGAPPGAQRVNVVEVVDRGYSYSAVYLAGGSPDELAHTWLTRLEARGARVDARSADGDGARVALSLAGHRIDFSVIRERGAPRLRVVVQTDLPPGELR